MVTPILLTHHMVTAVGHLHLKGLPSEASLGVSVKEDNSTKKNYIRIYFNLTEWS